MKNVFLSWLTIVVLTLGIGAAVQFLDGWLEIVVLLAITVVLAFVCAWADACIEDSRKEKGCKVLYVATAIVASWPLLVFLLVQPTWLSAVAAITIPLIGISIREAIKAAA